MMHCFSGINIWSVVQVKAILVNIFGGIVNCATIANGIIAACKEIQLSIPLVVRLEGEQGYNSYNNIIMLSGGRNS